MPMATREQQNEYQRQWIARRRDDFFKGKICAICGSTDRLELDHIDPGEKVTHRIWSWSEKRRADEIAKCQVLCYTCHKKKTVAAFAPPAHGTNSRYTVKKYRCRCDACKAAHAAVNAKYRKPRGYSSS